MGLPYSRQINAAFEEVTPLVAAGFKVLRTTRNISILLAVIQVLTVWFLFLILIGIVALLYCVNPDLEVRTYIDKSEGMSLCAGEQKMERECSEREFELKANLRQYERKNLVTPWLRTIARITIWGIVKSAISTGLVLGITGYAVWKLFIVKRWVEDVEYEGNVDADEALENLPVLEKEEEEKKEKEKKEEKKNGKGKKK
jgi:hypothetical protein